MEDNSDVKRIGNCFLFLRLNDFKFCKQYLAINFKIKKFVIIKEICKTILKNNIHFENIKKNIQKYQKIKENPNLSKIISISQNTKNSNFRIEEEFVDSNNLSDFLNELKTNKIKLSNKILQYIIKSICNGLDQLHKQNLHHGNLTIDNIALNFGTDNLEQLFNEKKLLKLNTIDDIKCDEKKKNEFCYYFKDKYQNELKNKSRFYLKSLDNISNLENLIINSSQIKLIDYYGKGLEKDVEIINIEAERNKLFAEDMWNLGIIIYNLLVHELPFPKEELNKREKIEIEFDANCNPCKEIIDLILDLMQLNPFDRPNVNQILMKPFLKNDPKTFNFIYFNKSRSIKLKLSNTIMENEKILKTIQNSDNLIQEIDDFDEYYFEDLYESFKKIQVKSNQKNIHVINTYIK